MLTWETRHDGAELRVTMKGHLTEETPLEPLVQEITLPHVVFDLAGVARVNSTGCREWLQMVQALAAKGVVIAMERCSVAIVQQLTMVAGFEGNGRVRSFYMPFICEGCDSEVDQLVSLQTGVQQVLAHGVACPTCSGRMELDDLPENYEGLSGLLEGPPSF